MNLVLWTGARQATSNESMEWSLGLRAVFVAFANSSMYLSIVLKSYLYSPKTITFANGAWTADTTLRKHSYSSFWFDPSFTFIRGCVVMFWIRVWTCPNIGRGGAGIYQNCTMWNITKSAALFTKKKVGWTAMRFPVNGLRFDLSKWTKSTAVGGSFSELNSGTAKIKNQYLWYTYDDPSLNENAYGAP